MGGQDRAGRYTTSAPQDGRGGALANAIAAGHEPVRNGVRCRAKFLIEDDNPGTGQGRHEAYGFTDQQHAKRFVADHSPKVSGLSRFRIGQIRRDYIMGNHSALRYHRGSIVGALRRFWQTRASPCSTTACARSCRSNLEMRMDRKLWQPPAYAIGFGSVSSGLRPAPPSHGCKHPS